MFECLKENTQTFKHSNTFFVMSKMITKKIGDILVDMKLISQEQLQQALEEQENTGEMLGKILVKRGFVREHDVQVCLGKQMGFPIQDVDAFQLELELTKDRGDFFTNVFGLKLSLPITKFFLRHKLSANFATFMMFLTALSGGILLAVDDLTIILGLLLLTLSYIFDYVDGQVARFYKNASLLGAVQDRFVHVTTENVAIICLGVWLMRVYHNWYVFALTFIMLFWNQFRVFLAKLHILIYVEEFTSYPLCERKIIQENYLKRVMSETDITESAATPRPPERSSWREMLGNIRICTYTFNFFTFVLLGVAIVDFCFLLAGYNLHLKLIILVLFAAYYIFQILDFTYTYLYSDRIYWQINELEQELKEKLKE